MRLRALTMMAVAFLAGGVGGVGSARAGEQTFQLTVGDTLASVGKTNAFLVSLGRQAHGLKLVPGGTRFGGQTCAGFGEVYRLAAVTVLEGPVAFPERVTSKRGRDAQALATAFAGAGLTHAVPSVDGAESDRQFWSASQVPHGLKFSAEALVTGSDAGLLDATASAGVFRFHAQVPTSVTAGASYRFLVELFGRTASTDGGLVAFGEQRCFTFVDLVPVDVGVLERLVEETLDSAIVRNGLVSRFPSLETAVARRDTARALEVLAYMLGNLIVRTPEHAPPAVARRIVKGIYDVRRGLDFRPATAVCGNGTRETGEACDGSDFGGFDCTNVGYASGTLACQASCQFDLGACVANPVCGNGVIEINEECDNGAQNSDTVPDACRTNCKRAFCGDDVVDTFEDCEGKNLNGESCLTLGYDGGTLRCDATYCELDDEHCTEGE